MLFNDCQGCFSRVNRILNTPILTFVLALLIVLQLGFALPALAQDQAFLEEDGLIVIEAESVTLVDDWVTESTEVGHVGNGYIRWDGANYFNESGNAIIAYHIEVTNPGDYNMRLRMSHQGAPASDQENDVWTKLNDGAWIKTFHPGTRMEEGFTFHSFHEPSGGVFEGPRYTLSAGSHTLYLSARSFNVRVDRIHFYKDEVVDPWSLAFPESARADDGNGGGGDNGGGDNGGGDNGGGNDDTPAGVSIDGEQKKWHPIQLTLDGPSTAEDAGTNPFMDYRFQVTFTQGALSYTVPGYFAADGNAAETSATSGNKWRAHFVPPLTGTWHYTISMRTGTDVAISLDANAGTATSHNSLSGSLSVSDTDKFGRDHRSKGMLRYNGGHYFQFDNGDYFLKGGADSPENFLAFEDFDQTFNESGANYVKDYNAHVGDWQSGDPSWQGGKGKGIIGALNYLVSKEMNSVYFITMNLEGDGKDIWPWTSTNERFRYDVSKLAQWEIVFDHMDRNGIQLHVLTQETENESLLNTGLGRLRKLYYRELVARFGHHHALIWNLGEENDESTTAQRKEFADYIRSLDPYNHPIVIHTYPGQYDDVYDPLLGFENLEGPSFQVKEPGLVHELTLEYRTKSANAGRPWVINTDEVGPANMGVSEDGPGNNHEVIRKEALWGNLMAGGAGVEWYFGYENPTHDLNTEDWRTREQMWDYTRHALTFFNAYLPFHEMEPNDNLTSAGSDYVFAKEGEVYAIYLPNGGAASLTLPSGDYTVDWYNPRGGGNLQTGPVATLTGGGQVSTGQPPANTGLDWVALIRSDNGVMTEPKIEVSPASLVFGEVQPGAEKILPLTISNIGNANLDIEAFEVTGNNIFVFQLVDSPTPFTLTPGALRVVEVKFAPAQTGNKDATLRILSSDPSIPFANVTLTGSSVDNSDNGGGDNGGGGNGGGDNGGGDNGGGDNGGGDNGGGDNGGGDNGGGDNGDNDPPTASISVTGFTLINAETGEEIGPVHDGDLIDLSDLPTIYLNVRANTEPSQVGSVQFSLNENNNFKLENSLPYAMAGDIGDDYNAWTPIPGRHTIKAFPFTSRNATGAQGHSYEITFFVSHDGNLPLQIELGQNFPNPFAGQTTIPFTLHRAGPVKLEVYDVLGRVVERVANRVMPEGEHSLTWDASKLRSGTYFYRLENGGQVLIKQMILVK